MHGRKQQKTARHFVFRSVLGCVLILALSLSSLGTVTANTVAANVIDGDQSYSFNMSSTDLQEILKQAQRRGLEPLGPLDVAERVENTTTVNIRRGAVVKILEAGQETSLVAYKGDTLEQTLLDNSILLKEGDEITPSKETKIDGELHVEIRRLCDVTITADGKNQKISMLGGTVADALEAANIELGEKDSASFKPEDPLFDKMHIKVLRALTVKVTADGKTQSYNLSAATVGEALKKCGITLGEHDKVTPAAGEKLQNGANITVQRVQVKETTVKEEIDYETEIVPSAELYEDESEVKTAGKKGEKEVTYKVFYIEGKENSKEVLSEKVLTEPVKEVVVKGTKERATSKPGFSGGNGGTGVGTFVDFNGNTVSYSKLFTGDCTAYSVPGGTTSLGWDAVYGVVAVNPNIIPYGTKLYITSPDGSVVYGYGVAGDTGGACMEGTVIADLCYNTIEECSIIGRRTMNVYILA